ncbi:MAG: hypothetical protein AB2809_20435 [Candidatus Thiodiazotropha sp.]
MSKAIPGPHVGETYANTKVLKIIADRALRLYRYETQCLTCKEISTMSRRWLREKHKNKIWHCAKCAKSKKSAEKKLDHLRSLLPFKGIGPWLPGKLAIAQAKKRYAAWGAR